MTGRFDTATYRISIVVGVIGVSFGLAVPSLWLFASHMQIVSAALLL